MQFLRKWSVKPLKLKRILCQKIPLKFPGNSTRRMLHTSQKQKHSVSTFKNAKQPLLFFHKNKPFSTVVDEVKKEDFDLIKKYNTLIQSGEIEENGAQNKIINQLHQIGEDTGGHIKLLQEYREYAINYPHQLPNSKGEKSSDNNGGFWGLFQGNSTEKVIVEPKVPEKIKVELPEQFKSLENNRGIYLHGSPGTGKTYGMDMFYNELPIKRKTRLHFAEFMLQIHEEEHRVNQEKDRSVDTIIKVGNQYGKDFDLICIDEFQVLHISDAMILKRLFEAFFDNNIIGFLTSNRPPHDLYLGGLQRFLFLPFIDMVTETMEGIPLDGIDYRRMDYVEGVDKTKRRHVIWNECTNNAQGELHGIRVAQGRTLTIPMYHEEVAMMSFYDLGGKALGNPDYMALGDNIHTLILTNVPFLSLNERDYLRRFIWLVDALYNNKVRLLISTLVEVTDIYQDDDEEGGKDENFAFERTLSRLIEMKSEKYLLKSKAKDHL